MNRIARIVNRIVLSYIQKLPLNFWSWFEKIKRLKDSMIFVYDPIVSNKLMKGNTKTDHLKLLSDNLKGYDLESYGMDVYDLQDKVTRGYWIPETGVLALHQIMRRGMLYAPEEENINAITNRLNIVPRVVYLIEESET